MPDLTNLVEDIRTALAFSESVLPDKLAGYARQYAEECTKLNERLKQCLPHLRGGNVAEAVRLAEVSPNITETFNLLDFENRQDWHEVCDGLGLDVPPPLAIEIFQELNDAYLHVSSLEPLLKWHRLYALNGSTLRDRLAVLRSIAKADPMNLYWQTDQETFEKVRIKELEQDVNDAIAKKDMPRLQDIYRELTAPDWQVAPPQEYRLKICTTVLEKYADKLVQHFSAFDYPNAAAVYHSMQQFLSVNQMKMPETIAKNIRAAVQWIHAKREEKWDFEQSQQALEQFQQALEQLRSALAYNMPRQNLENLYYVLQDTASRANREIPEEWESQYRNRVKDMLRKEQYREGIAIAAIVGALMLISALFLFAFIR
jgi:tetratricopeptide (TPR) repeat protein